MLNAIVSNILIPWIEREFFSSFWSIFKFVSDWYSPRTCSPWAFEFQCWDVLVLSDLNVSRMKIIYCFYRVLSIRNPWLKPLLSEHSWTFLHPALGKGAIFSGRLTGLPAALPYIFPILPAIRLRSWHVALAETSSLSHRFSLAGGLALFASGILGKEVVFKHF